MTHDSKARKERNMVRLSVAVLTLACAAVPALIAQQAPPPSVMLAHVTSKEVAQAMGEILKPQKFKVKKASKGRIVLSQDRGNVAQATGEVMKVRLEMEFAVEEVGDSLKITATGETYYADRGAFGEQSRSVDVNKERDSFENLFSAVKQKLNGAGAAAATDSSAQ
jgi:hypothetical protein